MAEPWLNKNTYWTQCLCFKQKCFNQW